MKTTWALILIFIIGILGSLTGILGYKSIFVTTHLYPLDNSVGIFYRKDFEIWLKLCLIISTLQQN